MLFWKVTPLLQFNGFWFWGNRLILGVLTHWVEEVQEISGRLGGLFHHVVREANVMEKGLGKGVLHSSISFDV